MNPFPPVEGNTQHGWEVIERDGAPSVECKYDLDEEQEDREAALQQCARETSLARGRPTRRNTCVRGKKGVREHLLVRGLV